MHYSFHKQYRHTKQLVILYYIYIYIYIICNTKRFFAGELGSYIQVKVTLGILYVYAIGPFVSYEGLAILCGIIPVIMFVLVLLVAPETPTYLLRSGRRKEAEHSLVLLRGHEYDIAGELEELQQQLEEEQKRSSKFKDLISSRATVRASIAVMGLLSFLSFSGINVLIFYAESIFKSSSSSISPQVSSIIIGVLQVSNDFILLRTRR